MSRFNHFTIMAFACVGLCGMMPPQAKAGASNQKTIFKFSGPVEIPGRVLNAGTYVFKLADSQADRNVVEVFNKKQNHLYGIFLTIPDYHLKPRGKPIITFQERAAGAPQAVRAWFYPGDNYGHEFVYPKAKAAALAKVNNTPVASMPDELAPNTTHPTTSMTEPHVMALKQAPLKAQQPTGEEVEMGEVFLLAPQPEPVETAAALPPALPKTGSSLPLFGLLGLLSLGAAGLLRLVSARQLT